MSAFKSDFKLDGMRALHRGPLKDKNCKKSFVVRFRRAQRWGAEGFGGARHPHPPGPRRCPFGRLIRCSFCFQQFPANCCPLQLIWFDYNLSESADGGGVKAVRSLSHSHLRYQPAARRPRSIIKLFRAPHANFFFYYIFIRAFLFFFLKHAFSSGWADAAPHRGVKAETSHIGWELQWGTRIPLPVPCRCSRAPRPGTPGTFWVALPTFH